MARIPARSRPHYPPAERLAILELRAARAWSVAQCARRFLLTAATIASWTRRLDEQGETALVRVPVPVNRFPDFVGHLVQRLKVLCPTMGRKRISNMLARAGLHLAPSTVRRMIERGPQPPRPRPEPTQAISPRTVTAKYPGHVYNLDLTQVPTRLCFWTPWLPHAVAQRWPFSWWVFVVLDHYSRKVVGFAVFDEQPSSEQVCAALDCAVERVGEAPKYTVSDQGTQFRSAFLAWCERNGVKARFGAVGRYGSIAVLERFMRTLKSEALRKFIVPLRLDSMCSVVGLAVSWYNEHRPHEALGGGTPAEVYDGLLPANQQPRLEPRARYPASAPCAGVQAPIRGYVESLELRSTRTTASLTCLSCPFATQLDRRPAARGVRVRERDGPVRLGGADGRSEWCARSRRRHLALRECERRVVEGDSERSNSSVYVGERSVKHLQRWAGSS